MKLLVKTFTILFSAGIMYACNDDNKTSSAETTTDSLGSDKPAAMDTSHAVVQTANAEQDFLNFAVPANAKEILWLKAGQAKGSKDIKQHSAMMLKDHNKLGTEVKNYMAKKPELTAPALDTANTVNINDKTGADWDKAWADKMVDDHNELLDKLKKAQTDVTDADLKKIITNTIPVVESHLSMAKMVQDKLKK